ncbi:MAG TPA: hypothetical protein VGI03_01330 [Verrucomicrobiae bacterium]|jgi:hypothetical protein
MNPKQHTGILLRTLMVSMIAMALTSGICGAQSTNDSADNSTITDFSSFQVIPQRNIFDPNRYPRERPNYNRRPRSQGVPTFSLAGTMSYRQGMFAFFNGTDSDYQKAVENGGTIAGFTVTNITMTNVCLLSGGKSISLAVGAAMQQDGNNWDLNNNNVPVMPEATGSDNSSTASPPSVPTPAASTDSNSGNDVLKRLMQQRQQELK